MRWIGIGIGVWVVASPFVFGAPGTVILVSNVLFGTALILAGLWDLFGRSEG